MNLLKIILGIKFCRRCQRDTRHTKKMKRSVGLCGIQGDAYLNSCSKCGYQFYSTHGVPDEILRELPNPDNIRKYFR